MGGATWPGHPARFLTFFKSVPCWSCLLSEIASERPDLHKVSDRAVHTYKGALSGSVAKLFDSYHFLRHMQLHW